MKKISYEREKAVRFIAYYKDFDPKGYNRDAKDNEKSEFWRFAFYEVWRMQMTWGFAYDIEARDSRKNGAYVNILAKKSYEENVKGMLEDYGYREVMSYDEDVAIAQDYELDDGIYEIFVG